MQIFKGSARKTFNTPFGLPFLAGATTPNGLIYLFLFQAVATRKVSEQIPVFSDYATVIIHALCCHFGNGFTPQGSTRGRGTVNYGFNNRMPHKWIKLRLANAAYQICSE